MKYFEIRENLLELNSLIQEGSIEETAILDTLEGLQLELQERANFYAQVLTDAKKDIEFFSSIIERYKGKIERKKKLIEYMENALIEMHELFGVESITDADGVKLFQVKVRNTEAVVVNDVDSLEEQYVRVKVSKEPDKVAIKKAIKEGLLEPNDFVYITHNKHLQLS